jgi:hypothetical protein
MTMTGWLIGMYVIAIFASMPPSVAPGADFWLGIAMGMTGAGTAWYIVRPAVTWWRWDRAQGRRS